MRQNKEKFRIFEQIKNNPDLAKKAVEIMEEDLEFHNQHILDMIKHDEKQSQICKIS
jgi:hypothetical protein